MIYNDYKDLRNRIRVTDLNGKLIPYKPKKPIETAFNIENISWAFIGIDKKSGERIEIVTSSRSGEIAIRKELAGKVIFI